MQRSPNNINSNMKILRILKKALDNMSIGITISDRKRKIIYTNPTDASIHGYSVKELLGKDARVFAPSELWNPLPIEKVTSTKQWKRESLNKRKDGQLFPVLLSSDIVTDKKGQPAIIMTACEDISAHKQTAKELQESNQNHQDLLALHSFVNRISTSLKVDEVIIRTLQEIARVITPDISFFYMREDDKLHLMDILPKGQGPILPETKEVGTCLCGLAAREGKPFYSKDIHTDPLCTLDECKQAGLRSFAALPLCGREGVLGVLSLASFKERDFSKQRAFLEILVSHITIALQNAFLCKKIQNHAEELENEITERKLAEEAFKKESFFRATIIDNGAEGICACHNIPEYPYVRFTVWNNRMKEISGYTMDEINRRGWYQTVYPDPEVQTKAMERMSKMRHGDNLLTEEWEITRADEEKRTLSISTTIIKVEDGVVHVLAFMDDITEHKRADEALQESEERFRALTESTSDWIWEVDQYGVYTYSSPKVKDLLGYEPNEIIGTSPFDLMTDDESQHVSDIFHSIIESRKPFSALENTNLHKDGRRIILETSGVPIFDKDGNFGGYRGIDRDITERKMAEEKIMKNLSLLNSTIESTADGILVVGSGWKIERFNRKFVQMWNIPESILESRDDDKALSFVLDQLKEPDRFLSKVKELYARPHEKSFDVIEFKDGRYFERYSQPQEIEGKILGRVWSFRDVTYRKKVEEALKASKEKYRLLFENASDAIFVAQDEMIKFPNPQLSLLLGYSYEELTGTPFRNFIHPEDSDMVLERHNKRLQGHGIPSTYSFRAITKSDEILWVEVSKVLITWGGRPAALSFLRDITRQKKIEAQLFQAQKMEAIGQLAGGIAHDFNNLLTAIIGYGHLLKNEASQDDCTSAYIGHILSAAERAAILTNDLMTFSRKQIINPKSVNLNNIIKDMESLLLRVIGKDVELSTVLTDTDLTIMADSPQIDQILMNLATNAQDAMPNGGSLIIRTDRVELNGEYIKAYGYGKPGSYALLSIEDKGTGIDESIRGRIFEPFFTTKEVGKGTGLGLSMVYGIVKQHDGYINVYSEPGGGTTFKILLPLIQSTVKESKPDNLIKVKGGAETILIGEEDLQVRSLLKEVLSNAGYHIIEAVDGDDAVEVFNKNKNNIHLLVLDIIMPKKNGKEVYAEIKKVKPDIKILFVSGYSADIINKKGFLEAGMNFISKPVSPDELLIKVRDVLDK